MKILDKIKGKPSDRQLKKLATALQLFAQALEEDDMARFETIFEYRRRRFQLTVKEVLGG